MEKKRKIYLKNIPLEEAWSRLLAALEKHNLTSPMEGEKVSLDDANGRVTAAPVWATLSSPGYHAAAMDGFAVIAEETLGATETSPRKIPLGEKGPAWYVDTGDPLPLWADSVIMIEHAERSEDNTIEIRQSVAPWTHVRPMGEDMVATELVLPENHLITAVDLGAAAGSGHASIEVRKRPVVSIIPSGSELITAEKAEKDGIKKGDIIEYNSLVIAAQVSSWGGTPQRMDIVPDEKDKITERVKKAAENSDLVVIIAGSSAGSEDYTAEIVDTLGQTLVHGVAVKPGHPVVIGWINTSRESKKVPVIGVPGYPVSCALMSTLFIKPILAIWLGIENQLPREIEAVISRKLHSRAGTEEYLRVTLGEVDGRIIAAPLQRGAGVIMSLVKADGLLRIPAPLEGLNAGDKMPVQLLRDVSEIHKTIVHIGSHDICLDLLAQFIASKAGRFSSSNAGSLGGLIALGKGEAHIAGSHLLDPETGDFNLSYIREYLPGREIVCITFVHREQGLICAKGNPKNIKSIQDLAKKDIRYVNRQRGAGTRVLLDYYLTSNNIQKEEIPGYERVEFTHLAVAAAVQSGRADCGMGIAAAAKALDLDFIPLFKERYELITLKRYYKSSLLAPLLETLRNPAFLEEVQKIPGYDVSETGAVREIEGK